MKPATKMSRGCSYRRCGVSTWSISPSRITATRWPSVIASTWSCVTYTVVVPRRRWSWASEARMPTRSFASRFESGSSIRNAFGSSHDRAAHRDPLPLAARELRRAPVEQLVEPEHRRDLVHPAPDLVLRRPPHLEAVADVLADGHVRVEGVGLEDHRDVAVPRREIGHVAPADRDRAAGHLLEPGDHAQQRRLPAAGGPDESDELAVRDLERDVVEGDDIAGEDLGDVLEDDLGHGEGYTDTTS